MNAARGQAKFDTHPPGLGFNPSVAAIRPAGVRSGGRRSNRHQDRAERARARRRWLRPWRPRCPCPGSKLQPSAQQRQVPRRRVRMPDMNGIEAITAIRAEFPTARIFVLTTYTRDALAVEALKAGASGYLLKNLEKGIARDNSSGACRQAPNTTGGRRGDRRAHRKGRRIGGLASRERPDRPPAAVWFNRPMYPPVMHRRRAPLLRRARFTCRSSRRSKDQCVRAGLLYFRHTRLTWTQYAGQWSQRAAPKWSGRFRLCRPVSASHGFLHLLKSPADRPSFPSYSGSQTSVAALHPAFSCSPFSWLLALVKFARRRLIYPSGLSFRMPESVIRFVSSAVRPLRHHWE